MVTNLGYAPFMATFFAQRPLPFLTGVQIVGVGVALLVILEVEKLLRRRLARPGAVRGEVGGA